MGCYICGRNGEEICHHCYQEICHEHAHFVEEISAYLCSNCYEAHINGSANILAE
ncbi:MAG: hypothetical protein J7L31_06795 [Thermoplasmata archaeon]|nr:hypothetical protein [Thermoplasmata archaeon]